MANKKVYQVQHVVCSGSNYCEPGMIEVKRRMIMKLLNDIPFEDVEKLFRIETDVVPDGQQINIKIEL